MAKKRKGSEQDEKQLSLFDHQYDLNPEQSDDSDDQLDLTPPTPLPYLGMGEPDSRFVAGVGLG